MELSFSMRLDVALGAIVMAHDYKLAGPVSAQAWRAITLSSLVGMTHAETALSAWLMRGPWRWLAASSSARPSQARWRQMAARTGAACSPMPAVKTSASMPSSATAWPAMAWAVR
jgi:hypothetical protein